MADSQDLRSDIPVATAVRILLLEQLAEFESVAANLTGPDSDSIILAVHDLRVICRQIGSLLYAFSPYLHIDRLRSFKRKIHKISERLGPLRNLDVLLTRTDLDSAQLEQIRKQRAVMLMDLVKNLSGNKFQRMMGSFIQPLMMPDADIRLSPTALSANGSVQMRRLNMVLPEIFYRLASEIWAYHIVIQPSANGEPSADNLHRLRISCKRFRYALALFKPLFGDKADLLIKDCKLLQDLLGQLHDRQTFICLLQTKTAELALIDSAILSTMQKESEQLMQTFLSVWQSHEPAWFHKQLQPVIDTIYQ
jgi:CHAD domain-containing protein